MLSKNIKKGAVALKNSGTPFLHKKRRENLDRITSVQGRELKMNRSI